MFKILVDTCVWLDIAKDPEQRSLINVIEELIKMKELALIVPRTIISEFEKNKPRVIKESSQSLSGVFKRVKEMMNKFGDQERKHVVLQQLNDVDHKIPLLGESVSESLGQIEKLLKSSEIIEETDAIKLKAVHRAIEKRAPFHRQKNSINDAILIETYGSIIKDKGSSGIRFAFVTHNKADFSNPNSSDKIPHPDFSDYFSKRKSFYFIKLAEAVHKVRPELVTDLMIEQEFSFEPRSFTEILEAENELVNKVWYNRHQYRAHQIKEGKIKIIPRNQFSIETAQHTIVDEIWEGANTSAKKIEAQYGLANLGPWDDFEWGMINGKLSALRWINGEEWDMLDT
jgi:hypothetical protein